MSLVIAYFLLHSPNYFLSPVYPHFYSLPTSLNISTAKAKDTGGQLETKVHKKLIFTQQSSTQVESHATSAPIPSTAW